MESIESNLDRHRSLRPSCSGVVSCRWRRHLTAKLGTPDTRTKYGEMLTLNIIELLWVFWLQIGASVQAALGRGQAGQAKNLDLSNVGKMPKAKGCKKPFGSQVFNGDSLVPGCQMYQSRFEFVLEDLDSINHLDLAQRSKFSKPWNFQLRLQLKLSHATSEQHANICQFKSLVAGCQTRWSYGWEQNPWRYGSRIDTSKFKQLRSSMRTSDNQIPFQGVHTRSIPMDFQGLQSPQSSSVINVS